MTLNEKLKYLKVVLSNLNFEDVYHYRHPQTKKTRWIVWQEDSETNSFHANNNKAEQPIHGSIDLYTQIEFDGLIDLIQEVLINAERISWRLNFVAYEEETNLIHYEWEFEVY